MPCKLHNKKFRNYCGPAVFFGRTRSYPQTIHHVFAWYGFGWCCRSCKKKEEKPGLLFFEIQQKIRVRNSSAFLNSLFKMPALHENS